MLSIAICDGNTDDLKITEDQIRAALTLFDDRELRINTYANPFDLIEVLEKGAFYDIYILETELPGFSGLDTARYLRKHGIANPVIFITDSKEHALETYEVDALQYLIKPVKMSKLTETLDKAKFNLQSERRRQIVFKTPAGYYHVFYRNILYTETDGKYQIVHVLGRDPIRLRATATDMAATLCVHPGYVRCGSSYTLNIYHIDHYDSKNVTMTDGSVLPIPRGSYSKLNAAYRGFYSAR